VSDAPPADPAIGLGQIEAADPAFNLELFKRQAVDCFMSVKLAIQDRDITPVADMLGDSVYDQLRVNVAGLLAKGAIQHYDGLSPAEVAVVAAQRGPQGDAITLRIRAAATQYLGSEDFDRDAGPGMYGSFTEYWTFSRPPGAGTVVQRPECPTCGAPVDIDTGRICRYCKTLMPAPHAQLGWAVAAIRPAQENLG
jgi:predicted lipid-binding transport protein (Tim44 family)